MFSVKEFSKFGAVLSFPFVLLAFAISRVYFAVEQRNLIGKMVTICSLIWKETEHFVLLKV
ncbi:hypothetical protein PM8797T_08229 [Gimesia maris DSM 8797]|nr:hypothetical protein PM8797T_08229 [Gimesia maris DSM 8797]